MKPHLLLSSHWIVGVRALFVGQVVQPSWVAVCLAFLTVSGLAQPANSPRIGYVYPAGGQQGSCFRIEIGGRSLEGVTNVLFSGTGLQGKVLEHSKPLTAKQVNELRERLKELEDKRAKSSRGTNSIWTVEDAKAAGEIRTKLASRQKRQINPAIAERVLVEVNVTTNASLGLRDLRLLTLAGLSNPLFFAVGQFSEFREAETSKTEKPQTIDLTQPVVLNGQILPGETDTYRWHGRNGQKIVAVVSARELIPFYADAVPGWLQAVVTVRNSQGKELAFADQFLFHQDPVLHFQVEQEGDYEIEIRDSIYRGREDFVYRVTLGEFPFITSLFPRGARQGSHPTVALQGWNLPSSLLPTDCSNTGIQHLSVRNGTRVSNQVPFAVEDLAETTEQEPNASPGQAQEVTPPLIVNGRIDPPSDVDVFRFQGRRGETIVVDVAARRLGSPMDAVVRLRSSDGRELAWNDDGNDKVKGIDTHSADASLQALLPSNGVYYVYLSDTQGQGGPECSYRLRISAPKPDFALRMVPSSINAPPGSTVPLTVVANRLDGFEGDIHLALKHPPPGFILSGAWVPSGRDRVQMTLTVPPQPSKEPLALSMEGKALIQGKSVVREVTPAEEMTQAFAYQHLVPVQALLVASSGRGAGRRGATLLTEAPLRIPAGGKATIRFATPSLDLASNPPELVDPPPGITIQSVKSQGGVTEIVVGCDPAQIQRGTKGNLLFGPGRESNPQPTRSGKVPGRRGSRFNGTLPAVRFEVVASKAGS